MLVITRKVQEKVHIGDNITVTIVRVKGKAVRLGIEAPKDVHVMRDELAETMSLRGVAVTEEKKGESNAAAAPLSRGLHNRVSEVSSRRNKSEQSTSVTANVTNNVQTGFTDPSRLRRPLRMGPASLRSMSASR